MRYKKGNLFLVYLIASVLLTACGGSAKTTEKTSTSALKDDKAVSSVSVDANNSDLLGVMSEIKKEEGLEGEFIVKPIISEESEPVKEEEGVTTPKDDKKKTTSKSISDKNITVTESEASKVTYENYKDPSGYFTIDIPKGWKVVTGNDAIHFYICAYDPKDTDRRVVVQMLLEGFNNNFVNEYYQTYYGFNPGYLVISDTTTKGVFAAMSGQEGMDSHTYYTGFSYVDTIGKLESGADLIQATSYTDGGNKIEMLCTAYVQVISDTSGLGVNAVYANGVCMLTAKEEEFPDWLPVLDKTVGTLSFTNSYWTQRNREWSSIQQSAQDVSKKWNSVSDSIMSSWEKRSNTHDIMMQEQSDATLGYDRVLDTETGKIYKAETGFIDGYSGSRYKSVESGSSLYNEPVDGYINYK